MSGTSAQNQTFGLTQSEYETLLHLIDPLLESASVFIFGSRARGDHKTFSDIDLLLKGNVDEPALQEVRFALEDSDLPYKVDLVLDSEIAESYRESIEKDKIKVIPQ